MLRSFRAVAVVMLLVFSSSPILFAASSACATAPCCQGSKVATLAPADGCCEVSMCAQELPPVLATKATTIDKFTSDVTPEIAELLPTTIAVEAQPTSDSPPLPTRDRLALLAVLLI